MEPMKLRRLARGLYVTTYRDHEVVVVDHGRYWLASIDRVSIEDPAPTRARALTMARDQIDLLAAYADAAVR